VMCPAWLRLRATSCCCCCCYCVQIAGGYYGSKNTVVTSEDNKKRAWPVRLLAAYIVRPGGLLVLGVGLGAVVLARHVD
jgi:hypothetical protein